MTDSSTPSDSEGRPRPKLSLRKSKPSPKDASTTGQDNALPAEDAPNGPESKAPSRKLSLKNPRAALQSDSTSHPEVVESTKDPQKSEPEAANPPKQSIRLDPPATAEGGSKEPDVGVPSLLRMPLKLKGGDTAAARPEGKETETEQRAEEESAPSPSPEPSPQSADTPQEPPRKKADATNPESIFDLPFNLPERVADDPPPLPIIKRPAKAKTVTFDDLEPIASSKPPPPRDAPVIRKKGLSASLGKVFTVGLAVIFVCLLFAYIAILFRGDDEEIVPEAPAGGPTAPSVDPRVPIPQTQEGSTVSDPALAPDAPAVHAPTPSLPEPDPDLAFIVDNLSISIARASSDNPVVIIDGVSYTPGSIIDTRSGLKFVGFSSNLREAIFEDERGARYYRYY